MGWFMKEHDIFVGSILDELNLRFAPSQGIDSLQGGVEELAELQTEFKLFKKGRTFKTSCAALNLCARNNEAKNRWFKYLTSLQKHESNVKGLDGDQAIVAAIVKNFGVAKPLPIFFTSHDMRGDKANAQVRITGISRPIHYLEQDYLTISLPMQPQLAVKKPTTRK